MAHSDLAPSEGGSKRRPRDASALPAGTVIAGRFTVTEPVPGPGSLGSTYAATDGQTGARVGVRLIEPGLVEAPHEVERLRADLQLAQALDHKNIAQTVAFVDDGARRFLVYEFVDGQSLREFLERKQQQGKVFSVKAAYNIVAHLCNALSYAHRTLVHGVLAPDCVWVNTAGRVKVTDFGLGATVASRPGFGERRAAGELPYCAPELGSGAAVDVRTDLYSVGAILYQLLCGQVPRPGPNGAVQPPSRLRPGLSSQVDQVIARCLNPSPSSRYGDPLELKQAIFTAIEGRKSDAPPSMDDPGSGAAPLPPPGNFGGQISQRVQTQLGVPGSGSTSTRPPQVMPGAQPRKPGMIQIPTQHGVGPELVRGRIPTPSVFGDDDADERWLVQKDKLDFGPFTLQEVKRQIERGDIKGDHVLIDNTTGQRKRVKDHPAVQAFYAEAEKRLEQRRRSEAEAKLERAEKRKSRGLIVGLIVTVLAVGGGVAAILLLRKPTVVKEVVKVRDPENLEDALKGITVEFKSTKPPERRRKAGGGGGAARPAGSPGGDDFDAPTVLGDATEGGGDEQLSQAQIQSVMNANARSLTSCILEERRRNPAIPRVDLDFVVQNTGKVSAVRVNGEKGTPIAACMLGKMRSFNFPRYNGPKTVASYGFTLR